MIALEQMENNLPLRQIIEKHAAALGCTPKALHNHWDRADASFKVKEHAARRLSSLQEQILLYTAQAFSASNLGLTPAQIRRIGSRLWDIDISSAWVTKWLKRNKKEISHRKCVGLSKNRVDVEQLSLDIENFISQLSMRYETLHFPNVAIYNVDETRVSFKESGIQFSRIEWTQRE